MRDRRARRGPGRPHGRGGRALDGPRVETLRQIAGDLGRWIVPGSFYERSAEGDVYNTTVLLSPQGEIVASYRKCFPWRPNEVCRPGDRFVVADIPGRGRVGLSIFATWRGWARR